MCARLEDCTVIPRSDLRTFPCTAFAQNLHMHLHASDLHCTLLAFVFAVACEDEHVTTASLVTVMPDQLSHEDLRSNQDCIALHCISGSDLVCPQLMCSHTLCKCACTHHHMLHTSHVTVPSLAMPIELFVQVCCPSSVCMAS